MKFFEANENMRNSRNNMESSDNRLQSEGMF